ncbi:SNase-domain-containing protein [Neurospora crassa]|nr:SNase-domain-containing protein [Neurospora crassa]
MCIHHRLIYRKCGHFTWLGITKKCQSERNFDQGKIDEGCNVMWTHPLSTYRVDRCCESCALERARTDRAIDEIRGRIQLTRELLAKIQDLREASSGVLERGWSDGGVESAASMNRGSIVKVGLLTMPWGLWASPTGKDEGTPSPSLSTKYSSTTSTTSVNHSNHGIHNMLSNFLSNSPRPTERAPPPAADMKDIPPIPPQLKKRAVSWNDSLWTLIDWQHYQEPRSIVLYTLPTIGAFALFGIWRSFLRRFRGTAYISPGFFRRRTLLGKVTSVGDGDNFHFFHTPGGRLAGWGWLRRVPMVRKELKDRTIPIRIAGIDAPEGAHFGRPAQPYSSEALQWLRNYILGKRVRARIYRKDQYDRVVATVFVRKPPFFLRKDVGLEMLKLGLATTYEAKTGAEFGGPKMEQVYKNAEAAARRKGKGMWANTLTGFFGLGRRREIESPRQYKDRMRAAGNTILGKKTAPPKATTATKKAPAVKRETAAAAKKEKTKATAADSTVAKMP